MTLPRVVVRVAEGVVSTPVGSRPLGPLPPAGAPAHEYGRALFAALLGPLWPRVLENHAGRGVELALDLPAELHDHMWEAMHDGEHPLGANPGLLVAVTRLVPSNAGPPPAVRGAPRVLFASGAKLTEQVILPGAMFLGLLRECESAGLALARVADGLTLDGLTRRCAAFEPDLVHLVAHGRPDEDGRVLVDLAGAMATPEQLVAALLAGGRRPLAVVLSVCHTARLSPASLAASLIAAGVPIVVAMDGEIAEPACRLFSKRLVRALLNGDGVAEAAAHGRRARADGPARSRRQRRLGQAPPSTPPPRCPPPSSPSTPPPPARCCGWPNSSNWPSSPSTSAAAASSTRSTRCSAREGRCWWPAPRATSAGSAPPGCCARSASGCCTTAMSRSCSPLAPTRRRRTPYGRSPPRCCRPWSTPANACRCRLPLSKPWPAPRPPGTPSRPYGAVCARRSPPSPPPPTLSTWTIFESRSPRTCPRSP
ncbi:CHAT domain-containing protein [Nonomuraea dietziae]|uniref:CHAT domain-containing protein n=1 Tax=Nonomuraea dietziae TaxID=65515 RepID=UPI0031D1433F